MVKNTSEYMKDHVFELRRFKIFLEDISLAPEFKYMIFHIFIFILHQLRVCFELTK